jgi:two-component system sensor histidine kinase CpxA
MKIRKLYIKILLCFVGILVVTEICIFGFFILFAGRTFRDRFEQYTAAKMILAKEAVEERIQSQPERPLAENQALGEFVHHLGEIYGAKVWLEGRKGEVYAKSFEGDIPRDLGKRLGARARTFKDFRLSHSFGRHGFFYAVAPVKVERREVGSLHILFGGVAGDHPEGAFGLGLLIIGLVVAVLIIPVSRLITRPVKSLNRSALRIAKGDLSHRTHIKGSDEIGELGRSFNEMAERLAGMIKGSRELTANVSHELRSPLARMRLAETLIRERVERGEYGNIEKHLDAIREDVEHLDRLIGRTLELSKLDIRETPLKREPLDLSQMIEAMVDRLRPLMGQKDLRLSTALSPGIAYPGDGEAMHTALSNLLDNAIKFSPQGGQIDVRLHSERDAIEVSISNTFTAIPQEDLNNIFEPFYRRTGPKTEGYGLGLAISKRIVDKHGGQIEAANSDKGFTVRISLPTASA